MENDSKTWQHWMTTTWRPLMAVTYMATIWFDFIIGPIIFNLLQYRTGEQLISAWTPLTLQGGGLYHLSMGAILGIAAWSRGQEKVTAMNIMQNASADSSDFTVDTPPAPGGYLNKTVAKSPAVVAPVAEVQPVNAPADSGSAVIDDDLTPTNEVGDYPNKPLRR